MFLKVKKQVATNSEGNQGSHVVYDVLTGKNVSCHASKSAAKAARRAIYAEHKGIDISEEDVQEIIKDSEEMSKGNVVDNKDIMEAVRKNLKKARKAGGYYRKT